MILCSVFSDLSYPCSLFVRTLSITQFCVLRRTVLFLTAPLGSCPMFSFYHKCSLSYLLPLVPFYSQLTVCLYPSFLQGWIPRLVYILLIPTGCPARTPLSRCVFRFCASNHLSFVSLHSCSIDCYEMLALPLFFLSAASFSFGQ